MKSLAFAPKVQSVQPLSGDAIVIHSEALDPITVYWTDYEPGRGMVTIVCWGCAWNCYFGAMNGRSIREFFAEAYTDYLVNKLGITQWLKRNRQHDAYLAKIIETVKAALTQGVA